jgi:hypothetical protein
MYTFIVILHIISVGVGVGLITMTIVGTILRNKVKGTPAEIAAIRSGAMISPIMGNIATTGLFVTGAILTTMSYSWFPFSTIPWLALKQSVFVVVLLISLLMLKPQGEKILKMASAELASPNAAQGASAELRALVARQYMTVMLMALLVLINISLGESKAMMWVTGQ